MVNSIGVDGIRGRSRRVSVQLLSAHFLRFVNANNLRAMAK